MADKPTEGDSGLTPIVWVIIILIALFVVWVVGGGPERARQEKQNQSTTDSGGSNSFWTPFSYDTSLPSWGSSSRGSSWGSGSSRDKSEELAVNERGQAVSDSVWKGKVRLGWGDFDTSFTYDEYVTISNLSSNQPINITGWKLVSPKNARREAQYSRIPSGVKLLEEDPGPLVPIVLEPGGKASVVSGSPLGSRPFKIEASFQINKCLGYLDRLDNHTFSPGFPSYCPRVQDGIDPYSINDRCDNFLYSLGCGTLERGRDREDNNVWKAGDTILNTDGVSSQCLSIAKERASYGGCVATHKQDDDFYDEDWIVFLDRRYELWPNRIGNVVLLDQFGRLVDQLVY